MLKPQKQEKTIAFLPNILLAQRLSQLKAQKEERLINGTKWNVKSLVS